MQCLSTAEQKPDVSDGNVFDSAEASHMRILVIEGNRASREATKSYLQFCGHEVEGAKTPAEARNRALDLGPQVLVCDCKLVSGFDGIEVAREIQARCGSSVIFVTAYSKWGLQEKFDGIKISDCLRKPVQLDKLADSIGAEQDQQDNNYCKTQGDFDEAQGKSSMARRLAKGQGNDFDR